MAPKNFFGGGEEKFTRHTIPKLHVFDQIFFKTSKLPNKKGTFDVNLVFTTTLACTKRALFITKKGTFCPLKKIGGHVPPGSYAPDCTMSYGGGGTYFLCPPPV
jgi:hypothetical protein